MKTVKVSINASFKVEDNVDLPKLKESLKSDRDIEQMPDDLVDVLSDYDQITDIMSLCGWWEIIETE